MKTILILLALFSRPMDAFSLLSRQCEVTAYCPCEYCCGDYADGVTASGHVIQPGDKFVAAPGNYPFGTKLYIPGYGWTTVQDRGGAIQGNRLDVFFPTHAEALQWGRQSKLNCIILGD